MLKIYHTDEQGTLKEINEITSGCWINLVSPTEQEMNQVADKAQIPLDFICLKHIHDIKWHDGRFRICHFQ